MVGSTDARALTSLPWVWGEAGGGAVRGGALTGAEEPPVGGRGAPSRRPTPVRLLLGPRRYLTRVGGCRLHALFHRVSLRGVTFLTRG